MRPTPLAALAALAVCPPALAAVTPAGAAPDSTTAKPARAGKTARKSRPREVRVLLNHIRVAHGLRPLRAERHLTRAARAHTLDMRRHRYFSHDAPNGRTVGARIHAAGYRRSACIGETIAWGSGSAGKPRALVAELIASPPHRGEILSRRFREVGVGVAVAHGQAWATVDFGARRRHAAR
jgi:uncharacterized protein YkwD